MSVPSQGFNWSTDFSFTNSHGPHEYDADKQQKLASIQLLAMFLIDASDLKCTQWRWSRLTENLIKDGAVIFIVKTMNNTEVRIVKDKTNFVDTTLDELCASSDAKRA